MALEYRDYCSYLAARQLATQLLAYFDRALRTRPLFESSNETNQPESANRVVRASIKLDLQTLQNIEQWAQANQFKMHEVYLAAMSEALYREDGQSEVAIGMPVTGRADAAIIDLIGGFYSVLPWILPRPEPRAFKEYVHSMKSALSDFYQHEQCSLGELWDRNQQNGLGSPEISVSFAFQDVRSRPTALFGQTMSQLDIDRSRSEYPLEHWVRVEADGLLLVLDYQPGVVAGERMEKLMRDIADRLRSPEAEIQITTPRSGVEKTFWRRLFG